MNPRLKTSEGHFEVMDFFGFGGVGASALTRKKDQYFVDGKPVTLQKALQWVARSTRNMDGGGGVNDEQARFYAACAKLIK